MIGSTHFNSINTAQLSHTKTSNSINTAQLSHTKTSNSIDTAQLSHTKKRYLSTDTDSLPIQ